MLNAQWEYPIYSSERVRDRKSVFLAHASTLPTPSALSSFLDHLDSLPDLKRATHRMYAYRIVDNLNFATRHNDGGEKGSGQRLSRLLEASQCEDVVVVVSRWYGGIKLGPDRWRLISGVAKEALDKGNFAKGRVIDASTSHRESPKARKKKK
ncbi:hypothetical protein M413DRAFT_441873 [Hebeloma cylindrosporum]|uniref:Impact N-terminal domain-containing protein n=1 Tax=Hebeloma cylindrosporum TaxID=76867 RepID=A0A0C3CM66_HEBCY|nr:hypothetical protein M413DRAFT_441873 [Hebeloma cylindrosporum h7]